MQKETGQFQQLEGINKRRERLSHIIEQRESLIEKIGTGNVKAGVSGQEETTLRVGNLRRFIREENLPKLKARLEKLEQDAEPIIYGGAREYIDLIGARCKQLSKMRKMFEDGYLREDEIRQHEDDFREFVKLPKRNSLLQKGIARIREDEARRNTNVQSSATTFPEGFFTDVKLEESEKKQKIFLTEKITLKKEETM